MTFRELGNTGVRLSSIGLGCMGMNHAYGRPDDKESIATMQQALDLGINFWDTADVYAAGRNEELVSKVLRPNRSKIVIATKFGFRTMTDEQPREFDGSPAYLMTAIDASLKRLRTDVIDLYYAHRIDPHIPVEEMVGAMAELVKQGKVRFLGLSEASATSLRKANSVHPITALQSEYSLLTREPEHVIIPLCKELKISFVPFSPLARGLITNVLDIRQLVENDFRKSLPRYQDEYRENNQQLAQGVAEIAKEKGCTTAQLALAWILARGPHVIPIPGTKRRKYLTENAAAADLAVTDHDQKRIEELLAKYPDTGARYNEGHLKLVDKD